MAEGGTGDDDGVLVFSEDVVRCEYRRLLLRNIATRIMIYRSAFDNSDAYAGALPHRRLDHSNVTVTKSEEWKCTWECGKRGLVKTYMRHIF